MRFAGSLASVQTGASQYQRHLPFFKPLTPMRSNLSTVVDDDDDVSGVTTIRRDVSGGGGGYMRHFERDSSDKHDSRQIGDGYVRYVSWHGNDNDDDVSSVTLLQLRPGRFGGISASYRNEFGRGPNSLLTGAGDGTRTAAESSSRGARGVATNDDGYTRNLNRHSDDDEDSSVAASQLRPGRFGGISQTYRNVFGGGPSTLLSGGRGFLTSSITFDDVETNRQGHGDAAASQQSSGGGSVLAALRNWRRHRDRRWQAPRDEVPLPEWLRDAEPGHHPDESFVDNDDSGSGGNNDIDDRYTSQFPSSSLRDNWMLR